MNEYMTPLQADEPAEKRSWWKRVRRGTADTLANSRTLWSRFRLNFRNWRLRNVKHEYVILNLSGSFPERDAPPRTFLQRRLPLPLPPRPMSMQTYNRTIQRLIDADNVHGVVLRVGAVSGGYATLQSLRDGIERLKASGKHVVAYLTELSNGRYYIATAADQIVIPPATEFGVMGLLREVVFLRDALAFAGIKIDNIQISPYKSAIDTFDKMEMTPEFAEQQNRLLDESFDLLVSAIAEGRGLTEEGVRLLIDWAPLTPKEAQGANLIDHIAYDDELAEWLAQFLPEPEEKPKRRRWRFRRRKAAEEKPEADEKKKKPRRAKLARIGDVHKRLRRVYRRPIRRKKIAVVSVEGAIMRGASQTPPVNLPIPFIGGRSAGSDTLTHLLRQVERDREVKALILHVNSPGGDALASELIARDVKRIAQKMPVVAYMGNVAASGGYFVSAPAHKIVAQPGTITGSIGVVLARPSTDDLYEKLQTNRVVLQRGENASLLSDVGKTTPEMRTKLFEMIDHSYSDFKRFVAEGRDLPYETLDPICEGRVWTGREALAHQLVDELGGFQRAIEVAAELAELPYGEDRVLSTVNYVGTPSSYKIPKPFEVQQPAELIPFVLNRLALLRGPLTLMPIEFRDKNL